MSAQRSRNARRLWLAALIGLTLIGSAYVTRATWSLALARAVLAPTGIGVDELVIRHIGPDRLIIERTALTQRGTTYTLQLEARGIILRYRWRELWHGRFDALHADGIAIALTPLPRSPSTPPDTTAIALEPPSQLLARLPVATIALPHLALTARLAAGEQYFSGSADYRDGVLQLRLADVKSQLAAQLRVDRHDRLELVAQRGQKPFAQLRSRIEHPRELRGELRLELEPLSALLQDWGLLDRAAALAGTLHTRWQGPLPAAIDAAAWRGIALRGEIEAQLAASDSSRRGTAQLRADYLMANGVIDADLKQADGSATLTVPAALAARLGLSATAVATIDARAAETTKLRLALQPLQLRGSGAGSMTLTVPQQAVQATLSLTDTAIGYDASWHLDTAYQAQLALPQLPQAGYRAQQVRLQFGGSLTAAPAQASLRIAPAAQLAIAGSRWPGGSTGPIRLRTRAPLELAYTPGQLRLPFAHVATGPIAVRQGDTRYALNGTQLTVRDAVVDLAAPAAASAQMTLRVQQLSAPVGPYRLQPVTVEANLTAAQRALRGNWSMRAADGQFALRGTLQHALADGRGTATATLLPLTFAENGRYLPALFATWPHPFDFSGGQLNGNFHLQWRPAHWSARLDLDLHEIAGFYQLNLFKGLSTRVRAEYTDGVLRMPATRIALAELDAGIALRQLHFTASAAAPDVVQVHALQAQLLGGRLYQDAFTYLWRASDHTIPLQFEGIQLDQLLNLEQNIEGSGTLDGNLPVTLNAQGIAVRNGSFQARAPGGVIRYRGALPHSALTAVPELQLALDSLRNFHYTRLDVRADYAPSGDLALRTELHGRNPELAGARPIHFNLNIRENIPDLLRGIQLSRDISDTIERRLQDYYPHRSQESAP